MKPPSGSRSGCSNASCAGRALSSRGTTRETLLEATLSRGDRRLADVIQRAWELGAAFDGWGDQFRPTAWTQAFADCNLDPEWYARRERTFDEILPWDFVSVGVNRRFLEQEYTNALQGAVIDDCHEHCFSCGILGQFKDARAATSPMTPGVVRPWARASTASRSACARCRSIIMKR